MISMKKTQTDVSQCDLRMLFLGDLMLDRGTRSIIDEKGIGHLTKNIRATFENKDIIVANLEGSITNRNSISIGTKKGEKGHLSFTFNPKHAKDFINSIGINVVCLGNNHAFNFKDEGLAETIKNLDDVGCEHFGDPYDRARTVVNKKIQGKKIVFVNYSRFKSGLSVEETGNRILEAKDKADFLIVYAHWGKEYKPFASEKQKEAAHHFVECGADLIIGSHPHVVQQVEIYNGKPIFYSLGNFIFDQEFSENVKTRLAVDVCLNQDNIIISLVPLYFNGEKGLDHADSKQSEKLLSRIVDDNTKNKLLKGLSLSN